MNINYIVKDEDKSKHIKGYELANNTFAFSMQVVDESHVATTKDTKCFVEYLSILTGLSGRNTRSVAPLHYDRNRGHNPRTDARDLLLAPICIMHTYTLPCTRSQLHAQSKTPYHADHQRMLHEAAALYQGHEPREGWCC